MFDAANAETTMTDYTAAVATLLEQAELFEDGPAKVAAFEEAARIADEHRDVRLGYLARKKLLPACLDAGQPDLMLVAYSWCLAQCDRDPTHFDSDGILWEYRWVISEMPTFPQITRPQIEAALVDITRRYLAAGSTLRPIHLLRMNVCISIKDKPGAAEAMKHWERAPRDRFSDDAETERAFLADCYFFREDYEAAFRQCESVLKGRVLSKHFFGSDCADLLYPLWVTGQSDLAEQCHKKGYRYVATGARYVDCCGDHVEYLALSGKPTRCVRLIEKHLPVALAARKPNDRMAFLRAMYVFATTMIRYGQSSVRMKLPLDCPAPALGPYHYDLKELATWLQTDVAEWSARYDARNGNAYYAERLARCDADVARKPPRN